MVAILHTQILNSKLFILLYKEANKCKHSEEALSSLDIVLNGSKFLGRYLDDKNSILLFSDCNFVGFRFFKGLNQCAMLQYHVLSVIWGCCGLS